MTESRVYQKKWKYLSLGLIGLIGAIGIAGFLGNMLTPEATAAKPTPALSIVTRTSTQTLSGLSYVTITATCLASEKVTGGGFYENPTATEQIPTIFVERSSPDGNNGWSATFYYVGSVTPINPIVYAQCTSIVQ